MARRGRPPHPELLTPREQEVLGHIRDGLSNDEIASHLGISLDGVKYHVSEILEKLEVRNRREAARWRPVAEAKPWWSAAAAPLLFPRKLNLGALSPVIAGGLAVAVAAGIGLLVWALLATQGDGEQRDDSAGRIAFVSGAGENREISIVRADGSGLANLTNDPANDQSPTWSPDGTRIAFGTFRDDKLDIYVMDADGTNQTNISNDPARAFDPEWSPDGSRILFLSFRNGSFQVLTMKPDGSEQTALTDRTASRPTWSPDGSAITYTLNAHVWVMKADGSEASQITSGLAGYDHPIWSPKGDRIGFSFRRGLDYDVFTMDTDGSDIINVSDDRARDTQHDWAPDGRRIAFTSDREGENDIFIASEDGTFLLNLTDQLSGDACCAAWSPNGTHVAFASGGDLYIVRADGSDLARITSGLGVSQQPAWAPAAK